MASKPKILVVDDELAQRTSLSEYLKSEGYPVLVAGSGAEALELLSRETGDVRLVITDLSMPGMTGVELMAQARQTYPELDFIVITANATIESAIHALRAGAFDYLMKPIDFDDLHIRVKRLRSLRDLETKAGQLERENRSLRGSGPPVGSSSAMRVVLQELDRASQTQASILLIGETGVGKEVLARYIHEHSPRAQGPFVAVNCSAIPDQLLESEFFGFEKGAFTGADRRNAGYFEQADRGTLFLDELGEMDLRLQPKILRAIEERRVRRVGGATDIPVDVRFVAATNRRLQELVEEKKFRDDLYYRLNVVQVRIPPLRERSEDIPALVEHMVGRHARNLGIKVSGIDESFIEVLRNYPFPGNVRELGNLVERALIGLIGARDPKLAAAHLPAEIREGKAVRVAPAAANATGAAVSHADPITSGSLADILSAYERRVIADTLAGCGHDVDQAAERLQLARSTLYSKMSKYGVK